VRLQAHEPQPHLASACRDFAERLSAREATKLQHDDQGSAIHSGSLAGWVSGAYLTPLADTVPAPAKLAVSLLVDYSGSTQPMLTPLWTSVCALANALQDAGHAVAIDAWTAGGLTCPDRPVRDWGQRVEWFVPESSGGSTCLATSAEPAMGRLQATAPQGLRQVCIVITDGDTDSADRSAFLAKATVPCIYWVVGRDPRLLPEATESWAATALICPTQILPSFLGEQALEVLLGA
jgi:hypothetical protein